jgi:hypothetical protein
MDFTYWFPWKYAGVRFQGMGMDIQSNSFTTTVKPFPNFPLRTVNVPSGSIAAGVINADLMLRLPLDDFWPNVHLAPYVFGGFGGIFAGGGGEGRSIKRIVLLEGLFHRALHWPAPTSPKFDPPTENAA